ncbi:succinylglutamate desuccinylase/aspartoacylase family protein [Paucibacter sp. DJ1R-11]|uniref:succinylglutamate desuccinylase/aspartoacylase domain-containing protein n=1 Tax=Paucibacter sp. DJ1R-11 TaxID=2893556 RepID=UPI0021E50C55|nr:succinylglutamate desuccinylase/aspartoacylase family protein [Paucibacter sp. DJ1R-11]MCV2363901.1 succinylglutamate desuccinylase/aspartoacylase family protein [Paucibacter sp. DJ1R-11]
MRRHVHALPPAHAGSARQLHSLHFGAGLSGRKVYIQASLHADEVPPMLVAHHLKALLLELEAAGQLPGEIVLLPLANPIGLAQELQGTSFGRFDLSTGVNFNRGYQHLTPALLPRLQGQLGADAAANVRTVRAAAQALLAEQPAATETEALKRLLQSLALDADVVLDLHCDNQAVLHVYTGTPLASALAPLAARLGAQAYLISRESGDDPFDESLARHWWELAEHFGPATPLPLACLAATVELRGETEVSHELAAADAAALIEFLRDTGDVTDRPPAALEGLACPATALEAVEPIVAPHAGVLVFLKAPGDRVAAGEAVAELIDPLSEQRSLLFARAAGLMFARVSRRYASAGMRVCKVAGAIPFRSGKLLSM